MSEKQQQDQTHGYNSKAAEAIAAMPKDEQGLPVPNETAYNNSQVILNSDAEALARSDEMNRWSEQSGKYAETMSDKQQKLYKNMQSNQNSSSMAYSAEFIKKKAEDASSLAMENGLTFDAGKFYAKGLNIKVKPSINGMLTVTPEGFHRTDRSPTNIRLSPEEIKENEEIKKEAIRKAKEII